MDNAAIDRRIGVGLFGLVILGLCVCFAAGQEQGDERALEEARQRRREAAQEAGQRGKRKLSSEASREALICAFYEQMGHGGNIQDSMKAIQDGQRQQSLMNLKNQLGVSEEEWKVIQPRLERVYLLRHPLGSATDEDTSASAMATCLTKELWELLQNKEAKAEDIQVKLTALRNAKEKVRQDLTKAKQELRKLLTLRQEATLVLSDLLD